jgi:hypothetical protein
MNKAALIADLESRLGDGFLISITDAEDAETSLDETRTVTRYYANVATLGVDDVTGLDIGQKRSLEFYVYDEGTGSERAAYKDRSFINREDHGYSGSTLLDISRIFSNEELRARATAAIMTAAQTVAAEDTGVPNHAERFLLAGQAMQDVATYLGAFMFLLSVDATIQAAGPGGATDSEIQTIVDSRWNTVARAVGLIT